ncbi:hypothetical protein HC928_00555 [bacterium]|nr:hypothetical protein [bacterium]
MTQLAQRVTRTLSMYPGTSVQLYAEDRIKDAIQQTFELVFDKHFWPEFASWQSWTLNESTGEVTATLTSLLKRWEDLAMVIPSGKQKPLPRLPHGMNPYLITGETPRFVEPYNANSRVFRVWPLEATGDVVCYIRTLPDEFSDSDVVPFDSVLLVNGAAYMMAEDDGTNPGAIEKFKGIFEKRLEQLEMQFQQMDLPLINDPNTTIPTEWDGTGFAYGWRS